MTTKKPGENTGSDGGIYQQVGPRGGKVDNFATVRDNERLPPTTEPGHEWKRIKRTQIATDKLSISLCLAASRHISLSAAFGITLPGEVPATPRSAAS